MKDALERPVIGILGGAGKLGGGLAYRWAKAGYTVIIGSRDPSRAAGAAKLLRDRVGGNIAGDSYENVVRDSSVLVLAVPFDVQAVTLQAIRDLIDGQIIIDTTVALKPPTVARVQLPSQGSAGLIAREALAGKGRLVCAFQNVAAAHLSEDHSNACDVLATTDDQEAFTIVEQLASDAGMRALYAGPIENSVAAEALTSVLITLNRRYRSPGAGIQITGLP